MQEMLTHILFYKQVYHYMKVNTDKQKRNILFHTQMHMYIYKHAHTNIYEIDAVKENNVANIRRLSRNMDSMK